MTPLPTSLETVVLEAGRARVFVAPERGGMATRFFVDDRPIFYLDEDTLLDPSKNVRGGNPILFPSPGRLANDTLKRDGVTTSLKQHGFARALPWEVIQASSSEVTLRLLPCAKTRDVFPWDFVLVSTLSLNGTTLRQSLRVETTSPSLAFALGFHPYFFVAQADKAKARIPTEARRAWDNVKRETIALSAPLDLTTEELDIHLSDHEATMALLELPDGHRVEVRASRHFKHWVVWTLKGRDFVCLEPWTAAPNALNTGVDLLIATPETPQHLWTEVAYV